MLDGDDAPIFDEFHALIFQKLMAESRSSPSSRSTLMSSAMLSGIVPAPSFVGPRSVGEIMYELEVEGAKMALSSNCDNATVEESIGYSHVL